MREFFGFGGYTREPEGYFSWQHLTFILSLLFVMTVLAVFLGRQQRHRTDKEKNRVLMVTAVLLVAIELFNITIICLRSEEPNTWMHNLPLFLCSIQFFALPLAAFSSGRIKEAALDFVFIFGLVSAVMGTFGAAQNYNAYPVLSINNVGSGLTHAISGFASLYIPLSGMASMKKHNMWITYAIMGTFCTTAYLVNIAVDYNYMFLMRDDGTPYALLSSLVGTDSVLYTIGVVVIFIVYITLFYAAYYGVRHCLSRKSR